MKTSRFQRIRSGLARFAILPALLGTAGAMLIASTASAQLYTTTATTTNWDTARWSTNSAGPYTGNWVSGSSASFNTAGDYTFANLYGSGTTQLLVGNITTVAGANVGFTSSSGKNLNFTSNATTVSTGANSFVNFGQANVGGSNSVTKTGAGVLALNGASTTYSGGLTIDGGTVIATSLNSLGGNAGIGALNIGSNGATIGSGALTNTTILAKNFATRFSAINLNGDLQLGTTGTWAFNSDSASMSFGNNVALTGATRTITLGSSGTQTLSGVISGASLLKVAAIGTGTAGTLALSGSNTYSGGTEINGALLQVSGNNSVLGTGTTTLTGSDPSQLKISGGLTLANAFSIANSTGVKTISAIGGSSTMSGNIVNAETDNGQLILGSDGGTLTVAGTISGAGGLQVGSATLNGTVLLSGTNTYLGLTSIDTGTLKLGSANAIPTGVTAELRVTNGGVLDLNGNSATFKDIIGTSGSIVTNSGTSTLTLGSGDTTSTLSAAIGDSSANLNLIKTGTGSLTLASAFNSAGVATVTAGKVILTNQGFAGSMVVNAGATVAGTESLSGDLTVTGTGARIDLVGTGTQGPQSLGAANITLSGSTTTLMQIASDVSASSLNSSANLAYDGNLVLRYDATTVSAVGTTWNLFTFSNTPTGNFANISVLAGAGEFSGVSFTYDLGRGNWYSTNPTGSDHYLVFTPSAGSLVIVPEPSTWAMTLASVGFAGWMARRKKLASKKQKQLAA